MEVWRPRLVENEELPADVSFVKGQHVLVSTKTQERIWVQILATVQQKYIGSVCSRMHTSFGRILEFKHSNILETITEG